jgi:hypothetical protein
MQRFLHVDRVRSSCRAFALTIPPTTRRQDDAFRSTFPTSIGQTFTSLLTSSNAYDYINSKIRCINTIDNPDLELSNIGKSHHTIISKEEKIN